jgi:hypothetical protein
MLILRHLAKGTIVWRWNAHANGELLILYNAFGMSFLPLEEAPTEPLGHHSAIAGRELQDGFRNGTPVGAQYGADRQQPICSSAPKTRHTPPSPRYAWTPPPISNYNTSSKESEDSYYILENYYSDKSRYDSDMFRKN